MIKKQNKSHCPMPVSATVGFNDGGGKEKELNGSKVWGRDKRREKKEGPVRRKC